MSYVVAPLLVPGLQPLWSSLQAPFIVISTFFQVLLPPLFVQVGGVLSYFITYVVEVLFK